MKSNLLNKSSAIILIIDIQQKLASAQFNKDDLVKNTAKLAKAAKILDMPVVVTEQYPKGLGTTLEEIKTVLPESTEYFEKTAFDCCSEEGFNDLIYGLNRKQIIICGLESHICVHQSVNGLIDQNYEVHIVQDAIASRKEYEYQQGIKRMLTKGALPSTTEMVLFELLKNSKHPDFKEIQELVK